MSQEGVGLMITFPLSLLERDGYHLFNCGKEGSLEELALSLGKPVASVPGRPPVDVLVPKSKEDSQPGTLSYLNGDGAFPFHTETAYWPNPVDLVILKCVEPGAGSRSTILVDGWNLGLDRDTVKRLTRTIVVVRNGRRSFIASLAKLEDDRLSVRYDPACMRPTSSEDAIMLNTLQTSLSNADHTRIVWKSGQCLVFDNRRMLHSRSESSVPDPDRRLERIYVYKLER